MELPSNFDFSQGSLQDYSDCRRRFLLKYLKKTAWPAVHAEPALENERHIQRGERFHRLAQQYLTGVPSERLAEMANSDQDDHLSQWWRNFTTHIPPAFTDGTRYVELTLSAPFKGTRLTARYDVILAAPQDRLVIYDWKTSLTRPKHAWLANRLQTRVYPYLLVLAGSLLNHNQPVNPEQVRMIYWFTAFPEQQEEFAYTTAQFKKDRAYLEHLIAEIQSLPEPAFELTSDVDRCQYCVYRSLCDRGVKAGPVDNDVTENEPVEDFNPDLDLDQINEIQF